MRRVFRFKLNISDETELVFLVTAYGINHARHLARREICKAFDAHAELIDTVPHPHEKKGVADWWPQDIDADKIYGDTLQEHVDVRCES